MPTTSNVSGIAALTICESLLLALNDRKVLTEAEIMGVLADAAHAHANMPHDIEGIEIHRGVAALIQAIIDGGNSVRHPKTPAPNDQH